MSPTRTRLAKHTQPLPLLRTTERRDFKRCPQRWAWTWLDGLDNSGPPNDKLWFGTGWHIVMAHWYKNGTKRGSQPLKVWRDWVGDEMVKIRVNISGTADYKEEVYVEASALGEAMIGNYLDRFGKDERWSIIQVEKPFEVVIADQAGNKRVLFCGTYDGVYRDLVDGSIWLLEHKTAKAIMTNHLTLDDQAGGYLMVASRELRAAGLIGPREQIKGIMYNFARKSLKDERPLNGDGLATNKPTKDHYMAQMSEHGLIDINARWTLPALEEEAQRHGLIVVGDVSKNQPVKLFHREPVHRTARERNTILGHIQAEVEHMNAMRTGALQLYKNGTKDCSWDCKMYQMCVLHESGGNDWKEYRDAMFKVRDPYADHRKSAAGDE